MPGDVASAVDIEHVVQVTIETYGGLDVIYNNAGTETGDADVTDLSSAAILLINAQSSKVITLQSSSAHFSPPKLFSFRAPPTRAVRPGWRGRAGHARRFSNSGLRHNSPRITLPPSA